MIDTLTHNFTHINKLQTSHRWLMRYDMVLLYHKQLLFEPNGCLFGCIYKRRWKWQLLIRRISGSAIIWAIRGSVTNQNRKILLAPHRICGNPWIWDADENGYYTRCEINKKSGHVNQAWSDLVVNVPGISLRLVVAMIGGRSIQPIEHR